jgi:hypothetical protein
MTGGVFPGRQYEQLHPSKRHRRGGPGDPFSTPGQTMNPFTLTIAFGYVVIRVRRRILRGAVLEMLVKVLMFLVLTVVTVGGGFAVRGFEICLARTLGMDRAG